MWTEVMNAIFRLIQEHVLCETLYDFFIAGDSDLDNLTSEPQDGRVLEHWLTMCKAICPLGAQTWTVLDEKEVLLNC